MSFSKFFEAIFDAFNITDWRPWNSKYYPEWMKRSMEGDSPLLSRSEWDFIAEVRQNIILKAMTKPPVPPDQHLRHKLSLMKDNFALVVNDLKRSTPSRNYFLEKYPEWRKFRNMTITQLEEIAITVNSDSQNSAATRGVGSSVSLLGGLMCLVPGLGAVRIAGSVLMGLGSLASLGISFIELELLRQKIKEAEKIMLQDKRYSEKIWNWISDVSRIQEALDCFKNIDVDINLKNTARDLYICYKMSTPEQLKNLIGKRLNSLKVSLEIIDEIADVIGILIATFMFYDHYRPVFNLAYETYKCKIILSTACNVVVTTAKMVSAVNAGRNAKLSNFHKTRLGIGIALDILSIILAAKDMDSTSKESIEVRKAAEKLKEEAETFKNLYEALRNL